MNRVHLAVICSTRGQTEARSNFERQSIESRFYSANETEHFLGALRGAGFLVHPFFEETRFIEWVSAGQHTKDLPRELLVISTGASFPGVGSKSLIPAFCRMHRLEIVGPDPHTASMARHKYHSNLILRSLGDIAPQTWCYDPRSGWLNRSRPPDGEPVIIKLTHEGASIGIDEHSIVTADATLTDKVAVIAHDYAQAVIVQEFVSGYEVEVPIFCTPRPHALMPVGISIQKMRRLGERVLTYDLSQADAYEFWDFETEGPTKVAANVRNLAEACAEVLGVRDLARIDFRIGKSGRPKVIDVSTSPYLSPHSSFAFVAAACGGTATELPVILVGVAAARLGMCPHPPQPK